MNTPEAVWEGRVAESFLSTILEGVKSRKDRKGRLLWVESLSEQGPIWEGKVDAPQFQHIMDAVRKNMNRQGKLLWVDTD